MSHLDPNKPPTREELRQLKDDEVIDLVRETIQHLNALADKLESYAERRLTLKEKGVWNEDE